MHVDIGAFRIGDNQPCFIIGEIGINHNGDVNLAKRLVTIIKDAGCNAVKFQKRTPDACVPEEQKRQMRETPWGYISYMEYRHRVEFGQCEYDEINRHCKSLGIMWTASCWDTASIDFIEQFDPPFHKVASACLTDDTVLRRIRDTNRPVILSTGMSTIEQIDHAVDVLGNQKLILLHCVGSYPAYYEELNLRCISTLHNRYRVPVGYSGHETGLPATIAAVALGASVLERHVTADRSMWGSDQATSFETSGIEKLVKYIRTIEPAMGDGVRRLSPGEQAMIKRLRRC